jgi:ATP-dependent helicase/nuclease subunit A
VTVLQFPGSGRARRDAERDDESARERIRTSLDESLLVEAAAGTGKTTVLVERLVAVLAQGHATVDRVVAVTFTRKAAGELKLRLRHKLDEELGKSTDEQVSDRLANAIARLEEARVGTIHSFCAEILRERPVEAGVDPAFSEVADDEAPRIYRQAFDRFIQERLEEMTPGLQRALARLSGGGGFWEGSPLDRLRQAGWDLVEWRDFPTPWERRPFDREGTLEAVAERVRRLGELARRGKPGDQLRRSLEPVMLAALWLERSEQARGEAPRDDDVLEARLLELRREMRKPWRNKKGSGATFAPDLPREQVLRERDGLIAALDVLRRDADADLAALLAAELRGATERYEELKRSLGKLDFQDLLIKTRDLLQRDASVRRHLQGRFTHLFVDEFQDTDPLQAEILLLLAAEEVRVGEDAPGQALTPDPSPARGRGWLDLGVVPGKLFLVGDPKQSIYRFRRADIELYQLVKERLAARGVVTLELNRSFRSIAPIQRFVNRAFAPRMKRDPLAASPEYIPLTQHRDPIGDQPAVVALPVPAPYGMYRVAIERIEASLPDATAAWIDWLLHTSGWKVQDPIDKERLVPVQARHVCLLFRRYMSWRGWRQEDMTRAYTRALEARGIDHLLIGARTFHHREEVETLRAALTAVEWPDDELAVFATLRGSLFALRDDTLLRFGQAFGFHPLRFWSKASSEAGGPPGEPSGGIGERAALDPGLQAVGEALDLLARLHRRRNHRAIVETLSELLEHTRAHAGFALRPAGHQVLGNVERVLDLARAYEIGGGRSFRGFVELLEEEAEKAATAQAPLVEEGAEGVRLMTVHNAKGLEFPVVVLADMTGQLASSEPSLTVDAERGLCAQRLLGWSPHELIERAEIELARDRAEGVRVAYVAATRARDLLVVPVVGDEKRTGWLEPLNDAVYPAADGWRRSDPAPGCPTMGPKSVLERPVDHDGKLESSVMPGLHRFSAAGREDPEGPYGGYEVVWWDPALLELRREPSFGLRQEAILTEDTGGGVALANRNRYERWRFEQKEIRARGGEPSRVVVLVTELDEDPPGGLREIETVALERDPSRPSGRRFGTLVHTVLQLVALDATETAVREMAALQARVLEADEREVAACARAVSAALAHPLLRRAAAAGAERELPLLLPLDDGRVVEGTIDLVIPAGDSQSVVVVDFKTDVDPGPRLDHYVRQLSWYLWALERGRGGAARGVLLLL